MVLEAGTELQSDHIGFSCEAPDKVPVRPSVRCSLWERTAATAVTYFVMRRARTPRGGASKFHDKEYRKRRSEIIQLTRCYNDKLRNYPTIEYLPSEIETWKIVFEKLDSLYPSIACPSYLQSFRLLKDEKIFTPNKIPQISQVSQFLEKHTGFRLYPISGLLSPKQFLQGFIHSVGQAHFWASPQ